MIEITSSARHTDSMIGFFLCGIYLRHQEEGTNSFVSSERHRQYGVNGIVSSFEAAAYGFKL